jgi:lysophospholipase L1-like esterase
MGLAVVTLLSLALCGEIAIRWFWDDPVARSSAAGSGQTSLPSVDGTNLSGFYHGIAFRTNGLGFRGPEFATGPQPGLRRIAIAGDSFVMGWGVAEEDTYAAQLEVLLDAPGPIRYEVINTGLLDINIDQAMDRLERAVVAYAPSVVVYGATLNDIVGSNYQAIYSPLRAVGLALRYRAQENSPVHLLRFLWPRWVALEQRLSPTLDYARALHHNYFENPAAWNDYTAALDRFAAIARTHGACALVLVHTNLNQLDSEHAFLDIYARIEEAAQARGLGARSTFEQHRGRRPLDLKLGLADGHPNPEGHALLAEALFDAVTALPDDCWSAAERG